MHEKTPGKEGRTRRLTGKEKFTMVYRNKEMTRLDPAPGFALFTFQILLYTFRRHYLETATENEHF